MAYFATFNEDKTLCRRLIDTLQPIPEDAISVDNDLWFKLVTESDGIWMLESDGSITKHPLPPATTAELIAALKASVQQWLDATAQANGYASLASCASYIGSSVTQWATDAKAATAWRDAVGQAYFTQMSAAQDAASPVIPTAEALIADLPQPAAYGWSAHEAVDAL